MKKNVHFNFQFKAWQNHKKKKGNIHFNVNFIPLYDINNSRIIDKFTKGLYFNVPANKYFNTKYSITL